VNLSALEQDIPRNLSEIYRALDLSQKRISALAASVKLSEGNLKMVVDMISLGSANQLDFVNARNALFQTKQGMLNAFYQNSIALANLDLATGRYLRYVDSEPGKK
jgi:outer membrane protein TolC